MTTSPTHPPTTPTPHPKRKKALTALASVVVVSSLGWAAYEYFVASHYESTDNAYVQGDVVQVTPQQSGTVLAILADDTDFVKAGQILVQLDPADAKVGLDQAEAALALAVRQARTLYANNAALQAQVTLREVDVAKAQSDITRAADDVARRQSLVTAHAGNAAVSKEELSHFQAQFSTAKSALAAAQAGALAAREQLGSNQALTEGTPVAQNPSVLVAAAKLREAFLATQRTVLLAPVDGYVAKRVVQLGQRVAAGAPLMAIVPLQNVWVDANFKEVQLRHIRVGQNVRLVADVYGKKAAYQGTVAGLGVGTGAAFALLPAQNATGNWIKVVQRVPVRIRLNPAELAAHPLRVGLSMDAEVDVSQQDGKTLADAPRAASTVTAARPALNIANPANPANPVNPALDAANKDVDRVIAANVGRAR
ncbi:MAG: HlyD family efflux transporter periplasmic adaptor subunit [Chitinophagaceae bacterium]|nr:HlyD family efflux transporter periplasmic adaptor subunit [Polaromonas sp.]